MILSKYRIFLGFEQNIPKEEMIAAIKPATLELATSISNEILRLNNNRPTKAVMLVGGGSLTPSLTTILAEKLNLPANRVAVRGIDAIQNLTKEAHIPVISRTCYTNWNCDRSKTGTNTIYVRKSE